MEKCSRDNAFDADLIEFHSHNYSIEVLKLCQTNRLSICRYDSANDLISSSTKNSVHFDITQACRLSLSRDKTFASQIVGSLFFAIILSIGHSLNL